MTQQEGPAPPKQPTTVEIPAPPAWAIEMATRLQEGFSSLREEMETRFDRTDANIEVVSNDLKVTKDRVALLESRADTSSIRVKGESQLNMEQQAQLAQEKAAREELAGKVNAIIAPDGPLAVLTAKTDAQTAILDRLDKLTANPTVKLFAHAVVVAFLYWLASKGIKVSQ